MKRHILTLMTAACALGIASQAVAQTPITVSLEPTPQNIGVGDNTFLNVVVSGVGNHTSPSLVVFDLSFLYDHSILLANSVTFGGYLNLGDNSMSFQDMDLNHPGVHLFEISFVSSADLNTAQPDSFTLATIGFKGVAAGTSSIGLDATYRNVLVDEESNTLDFNFSGARIAVNSKAGSVPDTASTWSLLALTLLGISRLKRRFVVP